PQSLACPAPAAAAASACAYRAAFPAQPSEGLYPSAKAATSRDAPECEARDVLPALHRAAAQMVLVGLQVRRPARPIHPAAKDTIARLAPPASDASVDPDAVRLAADLPPQCPEAVHGSRPSASADA